jgi:hypothetical protein
MALKSHASVDYQHGRNCEVEYPRAGGTTVHRAEHLHVADRVKAETGWDAISHHLDDQSCSISSASSPR